MARDSLTEGTERTERIEAWLITVTPPPTRVFYKGNECRKERKETTKRLQVNERT